MDIEVHDVHESPSKRDGPSNKPETLEDDNGDLTFEEILTSDANDMRRLGIKNEMRRTFSAFGVLSLNMSVMSTWVIVLSGIAFPLIDGGRAGTFWTYLFNWIFALFPYLSMAEMASMLPMAGGQYRWTAEFAPSSVRAPLSFMVGWLDTLAWQSFNAASSYTAGHLILIVAQITNPSYVPTLWQGTLLSAAVGLVAALLNIYATILLPLVEGLALLLLFIGFFAVHLPLWILAPKVPTSSLFLEFSNFGGWSNTIAACVIGSTSAAGAFIGGDGAAHVAQEVKNASLNVPRMMVTSVVFGGLLGLVTTSTIAVVVQNIETQIYDSTAAYPFIEVIEQATNSQGWAVGLTIVVILLSLFITIAGTATAARQGWAFAGNYGLPGSSWLRTLHKFSDTPTPSNAMLSTAIVNFILVLLGLAGPEAFFSIGGLASGAASLTYAISIACVLHRRLLGERLPPHKFSLGKFGVPCNVIAILYELEVFVSNFLPLFAQFSVSSMNWGFTVFVGTVIIAMIDYVVRGRGQYQVPKLASIAYEDPEKIE